MSLKPVDRMLLDMFFPNYLNLQGVSSMVFIDGENLTIRYETLAKQNGLQLSVSQFYEPGVFLWSDSLNMLCNSVGVLRKNYYTSVVGDTDRHKVVENKLKEAGIEAPHVFMKTKTRPSKGVDISIAVDMLTHASRKNYSLAIFIAGDGDYVPLVKAVQAEGSRVYLWFFNESNGLKRDLRISADYYADISVAFPF